MLYMLTGNTRGKLDEMACTTLRWFCMRARAAAASPDLAAICLRRRWLHCIACGFIIVQLAPPVCRPCIQLPSQ
jgi:hypothetical protein